MVVKLEPEAHRTLREIFDYHLKVAGRIKEDILYIATVWDTRQHPERLRSILR